MVAAGNGASRGHRESARPRSPAAPYIFSESQALMPGLQDSDGVVDQGRSGSRIRQWARKLKLPWTRRPSSQAAGGRAQIQSPSLAPVRSSSQPPPSTSPSANVPPSLPLSAPVSSYIPVNNSPLPASSTPSHTQINDSQLPVRSYTPPHITVNNSPLSASSTSLHAPVNNSPLPASATLSHIPINSSPLPVSSTSSHTSANASSLTVPSCPPQQPSPLTIALLSNATNTDASHLKVKIIQGDEINISKPTSLLSSCLNELTVFQTQTQTQ